ncbi:hypothetical protein Tco_0180130 [Tanacetum coccineum]
MASLLQIFKLSSYDTEKGVSYELGLKSVEAQLVQYQKNEVILEEKIGVLEWQVKDKNNLLTYHKTLLDLATKEKEEILKEKEDLKAKLKKFENSSKNLTKLLDSQINPKVKIGLGYGKEETVCDGTSYLPKLIYHALKSNEVSVETPKEVKSSAPLIQDWDTDSDNESIFRPKQVFEKVNFVKEGEYVRPVKHSKSVKIAKSVRPITPVKPIQQTEKPKESCSSPKVDKRDWNGRMAQNLGLAQRRSLSPKRVSTVRQAVNTGKGNGITAEHPHIALKDKGIADSSKEANDSASLKTTVDAEHAQEDTTSNQPFVLLPLWPSNSPFSSKSSADKEVIDAGKKTVQELASENDQVFLDELARLQNQETEACDAADVIRRAFEQKCYDQRGAPISSSTKTFSVVHIPVNTADDEIPELVEINNDHNYGIFTHSSYDDENWDFQDDMVEGAVADNNNMDTSNVVSSILTTRVHSFHPKTQIIGDPSSAVQIRSKLEKMYDEQCVRLDKAKLESVAYELGLKSVEAQLVQYQKNEVILEEKIGVLEWQVKDKTNLLTYHKTLLDLATKEKEEILKEKEDLKAKLKKFENSSKNLTKLLDSQISPKVKIGLGYGKEETVCDVNESDVSETVFDTSTSDKENSQTYDRFKKVEGFHAVPPPLLGNFIPPKVDLSFAGLDDFVYTSIAVIKDAPKSNEVSVETPKEVKSSAPLIQDWDIDSDNESIFRPKQVFEKVNFVKEGEYVRPVKHAKSVKIAKSVRPITPEHPQIALKYKGIADSGYSRHMTGTKEYVSDYQEIKGGFVAFGEGKA